MKVTLDFRQKIFFHFKCMPFEGKIMFLIKLWQVKDSDFRIIANFFITKPDDCMVPCNKLPYYTA